MTLKSRAGFLALAVSLGGCVQGTPATVASVAPIYSTDLQGKAQVCTVPAGLTVAEGKTLPVAMTMAGKGWCGVLVRNGKGPYASALLTKRPTHGKTYVHSVGDDTRIDYIPAGPVVADEFTVTLIPGNALVDVTVQAAPAGAVK